MQAVYVILGVILLMVIFIVYRLITVKRQNNELNDERFERIKPLYDKLETASLYLRGTSVSPKHDNQGDGFSTAIRP